MQSLYVIGHDLAGPLKVGIAVDPRQRLRGLQTGNPLPLVLFQVWQTQHPVRLERLVHTSLRAFSMSGEWFNAPLPCVEQAIRLHAASCAPVKAFPAYVGQGDRLPCVRDGVFDAAEYAGLTS